MSKAKIKEKISHLENQIEMHLAEIEALVSNKPRDFDALMKATRVHYQTASQWLNEILKEDNYG